MVEHRAKNEYDSNYVNCGGYKLKRGGKWEKLVEYAKKHSDKSFSKKELMILSGYIDNWTEERKAWIINATSHEVGGQNACLFSALNHWNYLTFDKHSHKWHIGSRCL